MPVMTTLFWGSAVWLGYTYAGYPLLMGLLSRWAPRPWRQEAGTPSVSLVIAAWNEAQVIEAKIRNALELDYPRDRLEIVIASDGSSDGTVEVARRYESQGVRVLDLPRGGKTATLNRAVAGLTGDLLVFSDANVFLQPDALHKLVRHFADPGVGGVSGDVRLRKEGFTLGESQGLYYRLERYLQTCESRVGSMIGADGGLYGIRRGLFRAVPTHLINDDFIISMEVVKQGFRLIYDPEVIAYEDSPVDAKNEFNRKIRVEHGNFQSLFSGFGVPGPGQPGVLAAYVSHKLMRWLGFVPLTAALGSSILLAPAGGIYALAAAGQVAFYSCALLGWRFESRGGRILEVPFYFTLENLAALFGLKRSFSNEVKWGTARTRTRSV